MQLNTQNIRVVDPKETLKGMLKTFSGANEVRDIKYNMFYDIYAFKGVVPGVGCSTIVANTALALADLGLSVCVFDTSILHPVQDTLLKTNYLAKTSDERIDWFDMPFRKESPLNISSLHRGISVLSFAGKNRTVLDMLSTMESDEMVHIAIEIIKPKFDIILIDLCDEATNVNTTSMQVSQQLIQIWSDSPACMASMQNSITNNVVLSCPMDKMRYVIENKTCDDMLGDLDALYKQYRFRRLGHCSLSYEIARLAAMGRPLWKPSVVEASLEDFNRLIIDVVVHILGLDKGKLENENELAPRRTVEDIVKRNDVDNGFLGLGLFKKKKQQVVTSTPDGEDGIFTDDAEEQSKTENVPTVETESGIEFGGIFGEGHVNEENTTTETTDNEDLESDEHVENEVSIENTEIGASTENESEQVIENDNNSSVIKRRGIFGRRKK